MGCRKDLLERVMREDGSFTFLSDLAWTKDRGRAALALVKLLARQAKEFPPEQWGEAACYILHENPAKYLPRKKGAKTRIKRRKKARKK